MYGYNKVLLLVVQKGKYTLQGPSVMLSKHLYT